MQLVNRISMIQLSAWRMKASGFSLLIYVLIEMPQPEACLL